MMLPLGTKRPTTGIDFLLINARSKLWPMNSQIDLAMFAYGTKRTSDCRPAMSAFRGKADINGRQSDICF